MRKYSNDIERICGVCQQVIFITGARDGFLFTSDMFNNYAKTITHVIIRHVKFTVNEDIAKFASSVFINLKKLERLEILGAKLGDNYAWAIPNSVDTLVFENNSYTSFDASMCPQLTSFAGNINNFTKLPKFPQPAFLTHLYMAYNPLTGLTLQDVGALCLLQTFDLKFVPPHDKYFTNAARHCFCTELKKWCKEYNIGGLYFDCANVTSRHAFVYNLCFCDCKIYCFARLKNRIARLLRIGMKL